MYSLIIPVYKNEESLPDLLAVLADMHERLNGKLEVVIVVDGSPDNSYRILRQQLPTMPFASQLLLHSRNFGSFAAIRAGMQVANGDSFAVMAADLQEPPELALEFFRLIEADEADVVVGTRDARNDPWRSRWSSEIFWWVYRKFIIKDIPPGGVDMFGCNRQFRNELLSLDESHSSLIGLLFWLGFRRKTVAYQRRERQHGVSAWTLKKKINYLLDSVFSFSDLPLKLLISFGSIGVLFSVFFGLVVLVLKGTGWVEVPGYAATILTVLFFGALNTAGIGLLGAYVWRAYANTQSRPLSVVMRAESFAGKKNSAVDQITNH
ncbi:MAG: glycosyltransferase family 2 protein [Pseudomonadales bacterium]|nr:glycosyltransferase family 2 protein [Pseudomonadales bacterium]